MTLTPEDIAAGWVEWRGGECPHDYRELEVRLRGDHFNQNTGPLLGRVWSIGHNWWTHEPSDMFGNECDIIAYRLHPAPVADEEKKL